MRSYLIRKAGFCSCLALIQNDAVILVKDIDGMIDFFENDVIYFTVRLTIRRFGCECPNSS